MDLDEFKDNWKKTGERSKSTEVLHAMTRVKHHPVLRRIRRKLIIESVLLMVFLLSYQNAFDAADKPVWANIILLVGAGLFILNDIVAYLSLQKPIPPGSLAQSIDQLLHRLKRHAALSIAASSLFGAAVILFMSTTIVFTAGKYAVLAGLIFTLIIFIYLSYKNWIGRISHLKNTVSELRETP